MTTDRNKISKIQDLFKGHRRYDENKQIEI